MTISVKDEQTTSFYRMRLPHWEVQRGVYFVTIHVHGSLPVGVLQELQRIAREASVLKGDERRERQRRAFHTMEAALHADGANTCLSVPEVAGICREAIRAREQQGIWRIGEYVLMPNHIHLLFQLTSGTLKPTMESFKRWTTLRAKPILQLRGSLWQREWFDHWPRSAEEDGKIAEYIRQNPVKAGLVASYRDWPYGSWNDPERRGDGDA
jgi:REP element-mobilizing transposase RayT